MANKYVGEVDIEIAGRKYVMRPSFHAISEIENAFGSGILNLINNIIDRGVKLNEIVTIIKYAVKAGSKIDLNEKFLENSINNKAIIYFTEKVTEFLVNILAIDKK